MKKKTNIKPAIPIYKQVGGGDDLYYIIQY